MVTLIRKSDRFSVTHTIAAEPTKTNHIHPTYVFAAQYASKTTSSIDVDMKGDGRTSTTSSDRQFPTSKQFFYSINIMKK